jgi:hypothetical protein
MHSTCVSCIAFNNGVRPVQEYLHRFAPASLRGKAVSITTKPFRVRHLRWLALRTHLTAVLPPTVFDNQPLAAHRSARDRPKPLCRFCPLLPSGGEATNQSLTAARPATSDRRARPHPSCSTEQSCADRCPCSLPASPSAARRRVRPGSCAVLPVRTMHDRSSRG